MITPFKLGNSSKIQNLKNKFGDKTLLFFVKSISQTEKGEYLCQLHMQLNQSLGNKFSLWLRLEKMTGIWILQNTVLKRLCNRIKTGTESLLILKKKWSLRTIWNICRARLFRTDLSCLTLLKSIIMWRITSSKEYLHFRL